MVDQWLLKARHDLEAARRIMAIEEGCPFDTVCFHCQQAAEKYVKGLLTYLGIQAPRSHDLRLLAALIPVERGLAVTQDELSELSSYAVLIRYPDDWREPNLDAARRAMALALKVQDAVHDTLAIPSDQSSPESPD